MHYMKGPFFIFDIIPKQNILIAYSPYGVQYAYYVIYKSNYYLMLRIIRKSNY